MITFLKQFRLSDFHTIIFSIIFFTLVPFVVHAQGESTNESQKKAWEQFQKDNGNNWKIRWNNNMGTPASLYGGKYKSYEGSFENKAKSFLKDSIGLYDFENESYVDQLVVKKTVKKNFS